MITKPKPESKPIGERSLTLPEAAGVLRLNPHTVGESRRSEYPRGAVAREAMNPENDRKGHRRRVSQALDDGNSRSSGFRAAVYARVSTANHGQDPTTQTRELREYCGRRTWQIIDEYVDVGISGTKEKRPQLDRLVADARRQRFDAVLVWKFDRFARSVSHLLRALELFRTLGIEFISLSEQVDTSTPTGKMVFTVLGAVAELERALIVERVKAGMRNARAKGKRIGRPPRTYLAEDARRVIAQAYERGEGSMRTLGARFGTSMGTVQRCIAAYQTSLAAV